MSRSTRSNPTQNNNNIINGSDLNEKFEELSLATIYRIISKVDTNVSTLSSKFDILDARTTALETENIKLKQNVKSLRTQLNAAESSIQHIQQKQFEKYITISNLPFSQNENLVKIIIHAVGLLKIEISKENITFCKRIGGYGSKAKHSPLIIVELDTYELKETILDLAKNSGPITLDQLNEPESNDQLISIDKQSSSNCKK